MRVDSGRQEDRLHLDRAPRGPAEEGLVDPEDVQKETEGFLIVADADGKNAKTIATDKGTFG